MRMYHGEAVHVDLNVCLDLPCEQPAVCSMTLTAFIWVTPVHFSTSRLKLPDSSSVLTFVTISPQNIEQMIVWVELENLDNLNLIHQGMIDSEKQRIYRQYINSVKERKGQ